MYYLGSVLADEDINVKVSKEGLLSQVNVTTEDKTGAIAIKLIDIAKEVKKFSFTSETATEPVEYDVEFDPCTDLGRVNHELAQRFPQDDLSVRLIHSNYNESGYGQAFVPGESKRFSGAAFRPMRPYAVLLRKHGQVTTSHQILLPNESNVYYYAVTRAAFVKKVTTLNFDEGILTEIKVTKPSEALAFMEIPLALVKAIASLPGEIVDNNIALTDKRKTLATSQTNLLTEQEKLEAEQQKVKEQHLQKTQAKPNPNNPPPGGESGSSTPSPAGGSSSNPD
ncbi:MAG TPA: hypothetical protein VH188_04920 [Chthoniobacterales bacterium]|jgi:hypothetical protein|nr:hypothetical protein [Chthoniobacterales bacterium]